MVNLASKKCLTFCATSSSSSPFSTSTRVLSTLLLATSCRTVSPRDSQQRHHTACCSSFLKYNTYKTTLNDVVSAHWAPNIEHVNKDKQVELAMHGWVTSSSALIKVVRISFPVPHEAWLFHSKSDGGLWATPASADHTCIHRVQRKTSQCQRNSLLRKPSTDKWLQNNGLGVPPPVMRTK